MTIIHANHYQQINRGKGDGRAGRTEWTCAAGTPWRRRRAGGQDRHRLAAARIRLTGMSVMSEAERVFSESRGVVGSRWSNRAREGNVGNNVRAGLRSALTGAKEADLSGTRATAARICPYRCERGSLVTGMRRSSNASDRSGRRDDVRSSRFLFAPRAGNDANDLFVPLSGAMYRHVAPYAERS